MNKKDETVELIASGELDDSVVELSEAIRDRQKAISKKRRDELETGDRIVFIEGIRPRYLEGVKATVMGFSKLKLIVAVDKDVRANRFSGFQRARVPASVTRRVTDED